MSLAVSQRRDQRRRLVLSWHRTAVAPPAAAAAPRRPADYGPDALPERQPSLAAVLPTSMGRFAAVSAVLLAVLAATVGPGLRQAFTGGPVFDLEAPRFSATLAAIGRCLDLHGPFSLGGWLAELCLIAAAATALSVRQMRRHRRDDYQGRYRAWGWLAALFTLTACAGRVPLGPLFAALLSDATGVRPGPDGMGWWVAASTLLFTSVCLWALLPLHERVTTALWLSLCLSAWAAAAACPWLAQSRAPDEGGLWLAIGTTCWIAGGFLAEISMLAAARSVLREVRGLSAIPSDRRRTAAPGDRPTATAPRGPEATGDDGRRDGDEDTATPAAATTFIDAEDGIESDDGGHAGRHLSKAERKRLRKLARMGRAA